MTNNNFADDFVPLSIEFSEEIEPGEVVTRLRASDGREIGLDETTWETIENPDPN